MKVNMMNMRTGKCAVCGCKLANGNICFDCHDPSMPKKELLSHLLRSPHATDLIKPEEGFDYIVQEEVMATISASASFTVFVDEGSGDDDAVDKLYESGKSLGDLQFDDIDVVMTEKTGKTRTVTLDGKPFNMSEWKNNQLSKFGLVGNAIPPSQSTLM